MVSENCSTMGICSGRGPIRLMCPHSTFHSCGISSSRYLRMMRPTRVTRGSRARRSGPARRRRNLMLRNLRDGEGFAVEAGAYLAEQYRAGRVEPDRQRRAQGQRQGQRRQAGHGGEVERALGIAIQVVAGVVVEEVVVDMAEADAAGQHLADLFHRIHAHVAELELGQHAGALRIGRGIAVEHQAVAAGGGFQRGDRLEAASPVGMAPSGPATCRISPTAAGHWGRYSRTPGRSC